MSAVYMFLNSTRYISYIFIPTPSLPPPNLRAETLKCAAGAATACCHTLHCDLTVTRCIKSITVKSQSYDVENPKDSGGLTPHWRKWAFPSTREPGKQSSSPQVPCPYVPCAPGAGRCSRQRRSWSGRPSRHTWAARGHRQHRQSCPPRFWHRQSDNKTNGSLVLPPPGLHALFL